MMHGRKNIKEIQCFATNLHQFYITYERLLQLCILTLANVHVFCNSTESRSQSVKIKKSFSLLQVSLPADRYQCSGYSTQTNTNLS